MTPAKNKTNKTTNYEEKENLQFNTPNNIKKSQPQSQKKSLKKETGSLRRSLRTSTTPSAPKNSVKSTTIDLIDDKTNKFQQDIQKSVDKNHSGNEIIMVDTEKGNNVQDDVFVDVIQPDAMSSPLKRKSPLKEDKIECVVTEAQAKKKKKRLLSKTKFMFPQEKLISPALKNDASDKGRYVFKCYLIV